MCATFTGLIVPRFWGKAEGDDQLQSDASFARYLAAAICFSLFALPGLLPALQVLGGVPAQLGRQADEIQVFERLKHHLDPKAFSYWAYAYYAVMLTAWVALRKRAKLGAAGEFLHWYLLGSALIAVGGLFVGLVLRNPSLMKFYPFRLFDVFLPLTVAVLSVRWLEQWTEIPTDTETRSLHPRVKCRIAYAVCTAALAFALTFLPVDRRPQSFAPDVLADWIVCCRWIDQNAPDDARVLTPPYAYAFKWYGQRVEYVNYKDCPQDAESLLEWQRRYELLWNWEVSRKQDSMSRNTILQFADHDQIDFVLAPKNEQTDLPVVHRGDYFWVYDIREL